MVQQQFQQYSLRAYLICIVMSYQPCSLAAGAKSGRLESLSGGSKQSQSTSSKLRLTADSSNQIASSSLQHVDSDADSHPRQTDGQLGPTDSAKRSPSVERQRTSDLSSRDILDTAEDKVKDESQSQDVADVRCEMSSPVIVQCMSSSIVS